MREFSFSNRPLCLCESRGTLNIPLRVRAGFGRQTILAHFEFRMKSYVVIILHIPLPLSPCPLSHSYPVALSILYFSSSKRTLTAARKSNRVTMSCSFAWPRSINCGLSVFMELREFVHYELNSGNDSYGCIIPSPPFVTLPIHLCPLPLPSPPSKAKSTP